MSGSDHLLDAGESIWQAQKEHPFVVELADGTLDRGAFEHWVKQDYRYLQDYARLFALAGATATDESTAGFPRGVDATGVTNAAALADAHEATLSNRSYRLTITYLEFEDGELRGAAHEQASCSQRSDLPTVRVTGRVHSVVANSNVSPSHVHWRPIQPWLLQMNPPVS